MVNDNDYAVWGSASKGRTGAGRTGGATTRAGGRGVFARARAFAGRVGRGIANRLGIRRGGG